MYFFSHAFSFVLAIWDSQFSQSSAVFLKWHVLVFSLIMIEWNRNRTPEEIRYWDSLRNWGSASALKDLMDSSRPSEILGHSQVGPFSNIFKWKGVLKMFLLWWWYWWPCIAVMIVAFPKLLVSPTPVSPTASLRNRGADFPREDEALRSHEHSSWLRTGSKALTNWWF